jgi:hypothetical protein
MRITSYSAIAFFVLVLGISCNNKKLPADGANAGLIDSNIKQEEFFVWVENAHLHEKPELEAPVIAQLMGGEKVIWSGDSTSSKTQVSLRGVQHQDIWLKVNTKDEKQGWIFKGMLTKDEEKALALSDFLIVPGKNVGRVKIGSTINDLESVFGNQFVRKKEIFLEGDSYPGVVVFGDSQLELQCTLDKDEKIAAIYLEQPGAPWKTKEGVKIGTTLKEIIKLNGRDLSFSGWGWDYGGVILSYKGGELKSYENNIWLYLGEPDNIEGLEQYIGSGEFSSSSKKLPKDMIRVAEIMVSNNDAMSL